MKNIDCEHVAKYISVGFNFSQVKETSVRHAVYESHWQTSAVTGVYRENVAAGICKFI